MAIGIWADFVSQYGFLNGSVVDSHDFDARVHIVDALNKHPAMIEAGLRAVAYDRPNLKGNTCMIILLPVVGGADDDTLLEMWHTAKISNKVLPSRVKYVDNEDVHGMGIDNIIEDAYEAAGNVKVVIYVIGGVAHPVVKPDCVDLEILDFDSDDLPCSLDDCVEVGNTNNMAHMHARYVGPIDLLKKEC